jgi:phosphoribosylformylglycinamidine synthase subunit PurS
MKKTLKSGILNFDRSFFNKIIIKNLISQKNNIRNKKLLNCVISNKIQKRIGELQMIYDAEVKISLKKGMLNPEAATIQRALALLDYQVENTATVNVINFSIEGPDKDLVKKEVDEMCQRLLCNPVIHDYQIKISPKEE